MSDLTVAKTISEQLGQKCLFMLGAKNLVGGNDFLQFTIQKNAKAVNLIKITLGPTDTYKIEFFGRMSSKTYQRKLKSSVSGVFFDMLRQAIEQNTHLHTSL